MVDMKLSFDPITIEHLGFETYSHLPSAVAELVANAYEADATDVRVILRDGARAQSAEAIDDAGRPEGSGSTSRTAASHSGSGRATPRRASTSMRAR